MRSRRSPTARRTRASSPISLAADGRWSAADNAPWKLVDRLKGFNWLDYYGGKFSTSQQRGVFMAQRANAQ